MKKLIILLGIIVLGFQFSVNAVELDNKNLKGLKYTRIQCEVNGIAFFKGFKNANSDKLEDFNLTKLESNLTEAGIPIKKDLPQSIYGKMEKAFKKAGLRITNINTGDSEAESTILPTVSVTVEITEITPESYAVLVYLSVSQWMSNWVGSENTNTPVITWWQKKMLVASPEELKTSIENASSELIDQFSTQFIDSNKEEDSEEQKS